MSSSDRRSQELDIIPETFSGYKRVQGAYPGYYDVQSDVIPEIRVFSYNAEVCFEHKFNGLSELFAYLDKQPDTLKHWIDTEGIGNTAFFDSLKNYFKLHNLAIEDAVSGDQRPKVETYDEHIFIISRMLYHLPENNKLINEQVAFFVLPNILLTIQDEYEDCLEPVRERLRKGKGTMRASSIFYLTYALIDAIVDNYFPMAENIAQRLNELEDKIITNVNNVSIHDILQIKREILQIRKAALAERDKISELLRCEHPLKDPKVEVYLRDTYDHCLQILEVLDDEKEIAYSLAEAYNSTLTHKTNEVMKVLTIISAIFIPLTFIVGVYGMNFAPEGLEKEALPLNMPELYHPYGYIGVWIVMIAIAIGAFIFFKRKRWI
ncbi:magnesium/cobalt transporter CorA [Raineya orbicola]|jgi:magnesium transporter|uniref:Magnesium transport protein CorA n=1 Tax=Raineya orbicola TaxID=2016530 RepID=A0A2N3IJY6_9BACT|nr:magnesium/cobalt transporter CorA [Raineya orbicola]PKQ70591.1 corA: magnesium and cobalt transport protein CorA [Raineya orbicola]